MSIYKKNNKYYCRFQIDGERHHYLCAGATTELQAKKLESQFMFKVQQQINGVVAKDSDKISFNEICNDYDEYAKINHKSYSTNAAGYIKQFKIFFGKFKNAEDIKANDIEQFKIYLLDKKISKITINRYLESLGKLFNLAVDNGKLNKSPYKASMKFPHKNYVVRYLKADENEEERIYDAATDYFKNIIFLALNTGLRKGNIIYLQGKHIKLDMRLIELPENKGNKHIKIYMNDNVYKFFKEHPLEKEQYLFLNPRTNQVWTNTAFRNEWKRIKEKAGINDLRFHDLRHTVGTRLAESNVPVPVIQQLMAHSDIRTTMRYVHATSIEMQQAMQVLNSYN